jgi:hypothetical protein
MDKKQQVKPKYIHIQVTQNGKSTANVHIPYFFVKMGMKFGQMSADAKQPENGKEELDRLKDIDLNAIQEALNNEELSLPCLLVDVDEPDKNEHVTITLE